MEENKTKKLIVAIPTRNNPEGIGKLFEYVLETYRKMGVDVMVFDSSGDNRTQTVTEEYISAFDNLYYQRLDSSFNLAQKMDAILSCKFFSEEYEYVWPIKDRNYVDEQSMHNILGKMRDNPDAIVLIPSQAFKTVYTEPGELYRDYCSYITSLSVMIYNYDRVLRNYSFNDYPDTRDDKYLSWWSPYLFALHKLAKLDNLNVKIVDLNEMNLAEIDGIKMTWSKDIFEIWVESWIKINEELPSCYDPYKEVCIKKVPSLQVILGSRRKLVELYEAGILTKEKVAECKKDWNRVSDIPIEVLECISEGKYDIYHDFSIYDAVEIEVIQFVQKFISLLENGNITAEVIPLDDIAAHLKAAIHAKYERVFDVKYVINGSIDDLCDRMKRTGDIIEYKEYMQMLLNYYLLCGR